MKYTYNLYSYDACFTLGGSGCYFEIQFCWNRHVLPFGKKKSMPTSYPLWPIQHQSIFAKLHFQQRRYSHRGYHNIPLVVLCGSLLRILIQFFLLHSFELAIKKSCFDNTTLHLEILPRRIGRLRRYFSGSLEANWSQ